MAFLLPFALGYMGYYRRHNGDIDFSSAFLQPGEVCIGITSW
jgi:hypothetical protein